MSGFTEFNGPQGAQPRGKDLYELTQAYNQVLSTLNAHINSHVGDGDGANVHQVKDYLDSIKTQLNAALNATLANYAPKDELATFLNITDYALKTDLPDLSYYALKTELPDLSNYALKTDLPNLSGYATKTELENYAPVSELNGLSEAIEDTVETKRIMLKTHHVYARVGGSDDNGVYYILGMLCQHAGNVYVKFEDDKPFSAVVSYALTDLKDGALSVVCDNSKLSGLKFKLVAGTDAEGRKHGYLAVQAQDWMSKFTSTDGYGLFDRIEFETTGINFIPVGTADYKAYNGACESIVDCYATKGLSFSKLGSQVLGEQIYRENGNPYVTIADITALDTVGLISQWPSFDPATHIATDVPVGYHACDGTPVLPEDDVSDEFRRKYAEYPLQDYSVIKTKSVLSVNMDIEPRSSLAEAVCALHGIKLYYGVESLPQTARMGEPVVVQSGNSFAVYAMTANGWRKYSTEYNDITKTIAAVAAVIATEHNADVYTVYGSTSDLPTGVNVNNDELAIVFDGATYNVFKYNGTAWELQS